MDPGFRLRQSRERLGLTYRDVERASLALARVHTRPQFTVHISRLAEIENGGVVPSLHKLYALAVVYHLNPLEILGWYDVQLDRFLGDAFLSPLRNRPLWCLPVFQVPRNSRRSFRRSARSSWLAALRSPQASKTF